MMTFVLCWCCLLLHLFGVSSEEKIRVHRGNTVKLFSDTEADKDRQWSLYVDGKFTAQWISENSTIRMSYMTPNYARRMYMDDNRTIWILCVNPNDTANYSIKYDVHVFLTGPKVNVELTVVEQLTQGEQIQMCMKDAECMKKYLGNLTREQILQFLDLHQEVLKEYCGKLTEEHPLKNGHSGSNDIKTLIFCFGVISVFLLCLLFAAKKKREIVRLICLGRRRLQMFWRSITGNLNDNDSPGNLVPLSVRITDGSRVIATEGESLTLTCTITASGTINVEWIGPNRTCLRTSMKYSIEAYNLNTRQSTLKINKLTRVDAGTYICHVTDGTVTQEDSTQLTVTGSVRNRWKRGGRLVQFALRWPHPTPGETDRLLPDQDSPTTDYAPFGLPEDTHHQS